MLYPRPFRESGGPVKKKKPPRAPLPPVPGSPLGGDSLFAQVTAELEALYGPQRTEIDRLQGEETSRTSARAELIRSLYAQLAGIQKGVAPAVQGAFQSAAENTSAFSKGYSDGMQQSLGSSAGEANALQGLIGAPEGQRVQGGEAAANVLYGTTGAIPASTLETQGAAFGSAAAYLPGAVFGKGMVDIQTLLGESAERLRSLDAEERALVGKQASDRQQLLAERRKEKKSESMDLYEAGFMTQRELARALGVKNWRKFPNLLKGEGERAKPSLEWSKQLGYLVDENLQPILDKKGKPVTLPEDTDLQFRTVGGYLYAINPKTGQAQAIAGSGPAPDKPPNFQHVTLGNKVYTFDPSSGLFYDPATGQPTVPRSRSGKPASPTTIKNGWKAIRQGKKGWWAVQANPDEPLSSSELRQVLKDADLTLGDLNSLSPEQMDELGIAFYKGEPGEIYLDLIQSGISPRRALAMVRSVWSGWGKQTLGRGGSTWESQNPKGEPASGGRHNTAFVQQAGFSGDPGVIGHIQTTAAKLGLDPLAVMAVALAEGGLSYGAVGDNGTSFGPFQLHVGGALPRGKNAAWANSPAGINYALRKIAGVARGLRGQAAIDAIVRRFERPSDPDGEIARAAGYYQRLTGASGAQTVSFSGSPSTEWNGSRQIAQPLASIAQSAGLSVSSEKRTTRNTASGHRSDHWTGSTDSYAYDLSGSVARMDAAARTLMAQFGIKWRGGAIVKNFYRGGYRIQILYRTNVGGDHYDHIHVGVRFTGGGSA